MATLATQVVPNTGLGASYPTAGVGGDKCTTGQGVFLHVKNGSAGSLDVVLATPQTVDGLAVTDRTVAVPAGQDRFIPVPDLYRNPADGLCSISYPGGVSSLTLAVMRVA